MGASMRCMREYVANAYDSDNWRIKVGLMKPSQVAAIYHNLKKRGVVKKNNHPQEYRQITIFEYLEGLNDE